MVLVCGNFILPLLRELWPSKPACLKIHELPLALAAVRWNCVRKAFKCGTENAVAMTFL